MRFNAAIRDGIMRVVVKHGGIATLRQIGAGLTDAGIDYYHDGLVYYVLRLRKDECLVQIGHAVYCTPEYLSDEGAGIFQRLPYGMCAKGWALHYMLTHRVVRPAEVHDYLVKRGVVTSLQTTYTTLWQLYAAGYAEKPDRAHYTLSSKLYEAIGISAPITAAPLVHISNAFLRSRVTPLIRELGPISVADLRILLAKDGIEVNWRRLRTAMNSLLLTKKAVKHDDGRYVLSDAPKNETKSDTAS